MAEPPSQSASALATGVSDGRIYKGGPPPFCRLRQIPPPPAPAVTAARALPRPCHCEPGRSLVWQSASPVPAAPTVGRRTVLPPAGEAPPVRTPGVMRESASRHKQLAGLSVLPHLSASLTSSPAGGGTERGRPKAAPTARSDMVPFPRAGQAELGSSRVARASLCPAPTAEDRPFPIRRRSRHHNYSLFIIHSFTPPFSLRLLLRPGKKSVTIRG
jgi:hypothetical protein